MNIENAKNTMKELLINCDGTLNRRGIKEIQKYIPSADYNELVQPTHGEILGKRPVKHDETLGMWGKEFFYLRALAALETKVKAAEDMGLTNLPPMGLFYNVV